MQLEGNVAAEDTRLGDNIVIPNLVGEGNTIFTVVKLELVGDDVIISGAKGIQVTTSCSNKLANIGKVVNNE